MLQWQSAVKPSDNDADPIPPVIFFKIGNQKWFAPLSVTDSRAFATFTGYSPGEPNQPIRRAGGKQEVAGHNVLAAA